MQGGCAVCRTLKRADFIKTEVKEGFNENGFGTNYFWNACIPMQQAASDLF